MFVFLGCGASTLWCMVVEDGEVASFALDGCCDDAAVDLFNVCDGF
jgi:hypothetical protein